MFEFSVGECWFAESVRDILRVYYMSFAVFLVVVLVGSRMLVHRKKCQSDHQIIC